MIDIDNDLPSPEALERWNNQWDTNEDLRNYRDQEAALTWLFKTYPHNTDLNQVLIKVTALNALYSTYIFHITETARHVIELKDFDRRVREGDLSLVRDLAIFKVILKTDNSKTDEEDESSREKQSTREKHIFSFASKYCSWHNPEAYPIYDSKVKEKLKEFIKPHQENGLTYKKGDLETYEGFCKAITELRDKFCLGPSMKRIDRYLWAWAKIGDNEANNAKIVS